MKVTSFDGATGLVDLKAAGSFTTGQCDGAAFQSEDNQVTIENAADCGLGLGSAEYTIQYCPTEDQILVNIVKPWVVQLALTSQECPTAGGEI